MNNSTFFSTRCLRLGAALTVAAFALVSCGSDDAAVDVPEGGTGNPYTQAIIESESHNEILLADGGDMVVAVDCDPAAGGTIVTVVADDLAAGEYVGTFDPATGVDITLTVSGPGQSIATAEMTLDEDEYTVTFADIEGAEFSLLGC